MADCAKLQACAFFNDKMASMPGMASIYKQNYCLSDSSNCARLYVSSRLGPAAVPTDLYPNGMERAVLLARGSEA